MRKFVSFVGYLVLGLPLTFSVLLMASLRPWALDRDFYKRTLTDDRLYAALQDPALAKGTDPVIELQGVKVDGPVFVGAVQKRLPVPEIKGLANEAVDATFNWLEGKPGSEKQVLDLKPLKKALAKGEAAVARDYAEGIPVKQDPPSKTDLTYRPATLSVPVFAAGAEKAIAAAAGDTMPDSLAFPKGERPLITDNSGKALSLPDGLKSSTLGLGVFTSLLLAGLSFLGGRRAVDRLRVAGNFLIIPSAVILGTGVFLSVAGGLASGAVVNGIQVSGHLIEAPGAGTELFRYFGSVGREVAKYFFLSGLVGTCVGGLLKSLRRAVDPERLE